jgi:hypothetical protein
VVVDSLIQISKARGVGIVVIQGLTGFHFLTAGTRFKRGMRFGCPPS